MGLRRPSFRMPDTTQLMVALENGLRAFIVEDHKAPLVTFTARIRGGTADDLKQGAAEALAHVLRTRGPCSMAPGLLAQAMGQMAADYQVHITEEMIEVTLNVLREHATQALGMFSAIVQEPCIDEEGIEAFRTLAARRALAREPLTGPSEVGMLDDGSFAIAIELFERHLFVNHPYAEYITPEEAQALTVEDVKRFHGDYFVPTNVVVAAAGAIEAAEMARAIERHFAEWAVRQPPQLQNAPGVRTEGSRQVYRYVADKLQTWIVIGHELPPIDPRDWPALEVMNYILGGGHFYTRLFHEARDTRGFTNDLSGFLAPNVRGPGSYTFRTAGRPEVAQELVDIVFNEVERIRNERVTEEELFVAKGALADGDFPLMFANGHSAAAALAGAYAERGTLVHLVEYPRRIRDVSAEQVQSAARRYLHPERMIVVIVGPQTPAQR